MDELGKVSYVQQLRLTYGEQFTHPPNLEEYSDETKKYLSRIDLRNDRSTLILDHLGLVRPPEFYMRFWFDPGELLICFDKFKSTTLVNKIKEAQNHILDQLAQREVAVAHE
ncbi:hypothetical protein Bca4012_027024 [Brassica carinata]|uniref:Uncharacterized protein n=1 Tax=Brassica carinata TaxID=52824 RepID=A0A8X8ATX1_BRACI|nr:hypothetical protein Bca52824_024031 [Brassica carinata]KAG2312475.1 hypothetical protein Bca52824_024032 [Brassica carinata]